MTRSDVSSKKFNLHSPKFGKWILDPQQKKWIIVDWVRTSGKTSSEKKLKVGWQHMVLSSLPSKRANSMLKKPREKIFDRLDEMDCVAFATQHMYEINSCT